ncbi:hypothetical protein GCM10009700_35150 [Brevibacterium sanguinis]
MCMATKRKLDANGTPYTLLAVEDQSEDWLAAHKAAGRLMAPIVEVTYPSGGSVEWSGFLPDAIDSLKKEAG